MYFCVTNQTEADISFANVPTNKIVPFFYNSIELDDISTTNISNFTTKCWIFYS